MIRLYNANATDFSSNGIGSLIEAISCTIVEERNGAFELEMEYPVTGRLFNEIVQRRIITSKPNPYDDEQAFRIYSITKPINGIITINAAHVCYDLTGYPVSPFTADGINQAFLRLKANSVLDCPFTFTTDKTSNASLNHAYPASMKSVLGGIRGSILDVYNGEYEYDNFTVKLLNSRGCDRGVTIRYGKNLTDLEQEENCDDVYTGVYPYWYSEDVGLRELSEKVIYVEGEYSFEKILSLDLSDRWTEKPSEDDLRKKAKEYIRNNDIGVPKVSLSLSFIQLSQSEEYKSFAIMEMVKICDTVTVEFPELNVKAKSKCIETTYNAITDRYENIKLGKATFNLASSLVEHAEIINQTPTKTAMEQAISSANKLITGGLGGHVVLHSSSGGSYPDEILIMNTDNIETATNVWRWNQNGFAVSKTGYHGEYSTAITIDGQIVADFITTGNLNANVLTTGIISSKDGENYWNLDTGEVKIMAYDNNTSVYYTEPTRYIDGDIWILAEDWNGYTAGTMLNAIQPSDTFVAEHWVKKVDYAETSEINELYTELEVARGRILAQVSDVYTTKAESDTLANYVDSSIELTKGQFEVKFSEKQSLIDALNSVVANNQAELETYIRFTTAGIEIGKSTSKITSLFSNDKLSFLQDGNEVAYISNNKLYITNADILTKKRIGNASAGYYTEQVVNGYLVEGYES